MVTVDGTLLKILFVGVSNPRAAFVLPAVVGADEPVALDPAERELGATVDAEVAPGVDGSCRVAEDDDVHFEFFDILNLGQRA